jgi:hypothetical protein
MQVMCLMQDGQTALWVAASEGHIEVVRLLVETGAEIDRADDVRRRGAGGEVDVSREEMYVYLCINQFFAFVKVSFHSLCDTNKLNHVHRSKWTQQKKYKNRKTSSLVYYFKYVHSLKSCMLARNDTV